MKVLLTTKWLFVTAFATHLLEKLFACTARGVPVRRSKLHPEILSKCK